MTGSECPSPEKWLLLVEKQLGRDEAIGLIRHAGQCRICGHVLSDMLQVRGLEEGGLLPEVSPGEAEAAKRRLSLRVLPRDNAQGDQGNNAVQAVKELFRGPVAAAAGIGGVAASVASVFAANTVLGGSADSGKSEPVRGGVPDASISHEGEHSELSAHQQEADMHQEIGSRHDRDQAIDWVFGGGGAQPVHAQDHVGSPGLPGMVSPDVMQGYANTCAIRCQELVLNDFGLQMTQEELIRDAMAHGWYNPASGTPMDDLGKLIEEHGVPVNRYDHANIFNLVSELAQGHRVILTVDGGELWDKNSVLDQVRETHEDQWQGMRPDHAVIVSGVDYSDPAHPIVVVTDPGTGEVAATYPLDQFLDAWEDSGFSMVATRSAPTSFPTDHIARIGLLPYENFAGWYPSVAGLTGHEPMFDEVRKAFGNMVDLPGYHEEHHMTDVLAAYHVGGSLDEMGDHSGLSGSHWDGLLGAGGAAAAGTLGGSEAEDHGHDGHDVAGGNGHHDVDVDGHGLV